MWAIALLLLVLQRHHNGPAAIWQQHDAGGCLAPALPALQLLVLLLCRHAQVRVLCLVLRRLVLGLLVLWRLVLGCARVGTVLMVLVELVELVVPVQLRLLLLVALLVVLLLLVVLEVVLVLV